MDPLARSSEVLLADAARRRKLAWLLGLSLFVCYPLDELMLGRPSPATLVLRAVWGLETILHVELVRRLAPRWTRPLDAVHTSLSTALFLGFIFLTGGSQSPFVSTTASMPLMMALVFTESALMPLLSGLVCLAGLLAIGWAEGHVRGVLGWGVLVGTSTFFGIHNTLRFRKAQAAEAQVHVERARREALEKLAVSERQRAQTEQLAAVGRLAANVMHELNNPLAFVRSNLDFLRSEILAQALPESVRGELRDVFAETHVGVERLQRIVSDLKGFSRLDGEEPGQCALADVVSDAALIAGVRLRHVARLTVDVPVGLPDVVAAPRRLAQVLLNLLVNAGDALEAAGVEGGEVRVHGGEEHGRVFLVVEDNGPGFTPQALERLFEAFYTTKGPDKGTGLGLCLSREMVERFGGTLRADNGPQGGARVRMELPVHRLEQAR